MNFSLLPLLVYLIIALSLPAGGTVAQVLQMGDLPTESIPIGLFRSEIFSGVPQELRDGSFDSAVFAVTAPEWRGTERRGHSGLSQRAVFEIGGVALTGVGHFVFRAMDESKVYIPLTSLGWGGYVYYRTRTDREFLSEVGFTSRGLGGGFRDSTFVAIGATALMAGIAARNQSLTLHRDLIPLFILYPAWGLVQQFLVQGMVSKNLTEAEGWLGSPYVVTPVSAALFASVHLPNWKLTAGTFALGLAFTPIYLKHGNLWPLGLYHGWLGALFYFFVLERNPWQEVFGKNARKNIRAGLDVDAQGNPMLRLHVKF
jgi:uncharacterized protein